MQSTRRFFSFFFATAAMLGGILAASPASASDPWSDPKLVFELGRGFYLRYCASCHGEDHRGRGPAARALKTKPPDLTRLVYKYGNPLPRDQIVRFIDGRDDVASHGTREMPIWGEVLFDDEDPSEHREQRKGGTLLLLFIYLEQIQDYEGAAQAAAEAGDDATDSGP